jgi:hypothetical protein
MIEKEQIEELDGAIVYPNLEKAMVGIVSRFGQEDIVCYDLDKCIEIFMQDGMTEGEARDYFYFNTIAQWVGEKTPCFIERVV